MTDLSSTSPFMLASKLNAQVNTIVSAMDVYSLEPTLKKILMNLKRHMADARLDARDYELSETREEQLRNAVVAKKRLTKVSKDILAASEYNIFNAVDVAHLTSDVDHIIERLE